MKIFVASNNDFLRVIHLDSSFATIPSGGEGMMAGDGLCRGEGKATHG